MGRLRDCQMFVCVTWQLGGTGGAWWLRRNVIVPVQTQVLEADPLIEAKSAINSVVSTNADIVGFEWHKMNGAPVKDYLNLEAQFGLSSGVWCLHHACLSELI
ncbi:uncharacterized protein K460DRAFT_350905 [Cucurbitaria berberidis CBS 394.84]|uniref:Uncharacterized protein n=1 Tax=Cucurbitaria berberidis CBS 394.84 TaxID=1168544 RepID=A0A9P4LE03_9PLEO|nr:uncharacterized protein K460DRAFT_350905 [Cucurbitaria berberidis CBS 394.84]KAF1850912.1 hypothetical protein K460DRAFT_350905 [Cucurbitaria berberidis CBS 394.84]